MFLTDAQIRRLTGHREKHAQADWLRANGVRYWVNAAGKPIVPCTEITSPGAAPVAPGWQPDFSRVAAQ